MQLFAGLEPSIHALPCWEVSPEQMEQCPQSLESLTQDQGRQTPCSSSRLNIFKSVYKWKNNTWVAQRKSRGSGREVGRRSWGSVPAQSRPLAPAAAEKKQMLLEIMISTFHLGTCLVPCSIFVMDNVSMKAFDLLCSSRKKMCWRRFTELCLKKWSTVRIGVFKHKREIFTKAGTFRNQEKGVQLITWVWYLNVKSFLSLRIRSLREWMQ